MTGSGMGQFARSDIRAVLARFGISSALRASDVDPTEEVFLLTEQDFGRVDPNEVALAIMAVLPSTKVWVIQEHPAWQAEPL